MQGRISVAQIEAVVACLLLLVSLTACATDRQVYAGADGGYAVVSLMLRADALKPHVRLDIQRRDHTSSNGFYWQDEPLLPGPGADFKTDQASGIVSSLRLAPGEYEICGWYVDYVSKNFQPKAPFSLPFRVDAGRVTYLGEYMVATVYGENVFGMTIPAFPVIMVGNQQARDIAKFHSRNPEAAAMPVQAMVGDVQSLNLPFFPKEPPPWRK